MNDAILNQTSHYNRSDRYSVVSTQSIIDALALDGYSVQSLTKAKVRKSSKDGYQKHVVRLRHPSFLFKAVNDSIPEIVITNSYDGTSGIKIMVGIFRLVCANGLVVGSTIAEVRIRHVGDALTKVLEAVAMLKDKVVALENSVQRLSSVELDAESTERFASQAIQAYLPESAQSVSVASALAPRRDADKSNVLWVVFNRVQEAIIRGGIEYTTVKDGVVTHRKTRPVRSIERSIDANRKLWDIAESYATAA